MSMPVDSRSVLSTTDVIELRRFSQEKSHIDQQISVIENQPQIEVFDALRSYSADENLLTAAEVDLAQRGRDIDRRIADRDAMALEVERFNVSDMNRLRMVAKASSKGHMSATDTDLIEITLDTIYSLDKLQRLLTSSRSTMDLAKRRLAWEKRLCECWSEFSALSRDIASFVQTRARWTHADHTRRAQAGSADSAAGAINDDAEVTPSSSEMSLSKQDDHRRSKSMVSWQMTGEMIELEAARLNLRVRDLKQEAVIQAGALLDAIIDQCQVPEAFIDEQEKLEDAIPGLVDRGAFAADLAEQWVKADAAYRVLKSARRKARDVEATFAQLVLQKPNVDAKDQLRGAVDSLLDRLSVILAIDRQRLLATTEPVPVRMRDDAKPRYPSHPAFPEQSSLNSDLEQSLERDVASSVTKMRLAMACVHRYDAGLTLYELAGTAIDNATQALVALQNATASADAQFQESCEAFACMTGDDVLVSSGLDALGTEALQECIAALSQSAGEGTQRNRAIKSAIARCEACGLSDTRKWLDPSGILGALDRAIAAASADEQKLVATIDVLTQTKELQAGAGGQAKALEAVLRKVQAARTQLGGDVVATACAGAEGRLAVQRAADEARRSLATCKGDLHHTVTRADSLMAQIGAAGLGNGAFVAEAMASLKGELEQAESQCRSLQRTATRLDVWSRALSDADAIGTRLDAFNRALDRHDELLRTDWEGQISSDEAGIARLGRTVSSLREAVALFERKCVDNDPLPVSSTDTCQTGVEEQARRHLNSTWSQLSAKLDDLSKRSESALQIDGELRQLKNHFEEFDAERAVLLLSMGDGQTTTIDGSRTLSADSTHKRLSETDRASATLSRLEAAGEGIRVLAASALLRSAGPETAREGAKKRLQDLAQLRARAESSSTPAPKSLAAARSTPRATPGRVRDSQRSLGLGLSSKHSTSSKKAANGFSRHEGIGSSVAPVSTIFAALLARSRDGHIPMQTVDDQGRIQMQNLLDLPAREDLEVGEQHWTQLSTDVQAFSVECLAAADTRLHSRVQFLVSDIGGKSQRFRDLCRFASAAADADDHQSRLLHLADELSGFSDFGSPSFVQHRGWASERSSFRSSPTSEQTVRIDDELKELDRLLKRAKEASTRVRSDVRVRRRLAKLVRSTAEVRHTVRTALDPGSRPTLDQSDDGMSICTSSSFDHLDWETESLGGFSRARSSSIISLDRSTSGRDSPFWHRGPLRGSGNTSRASVRSPLGPNNDLVVPTARDRLGSTTPSRIPRTPSKGRHVSQSLSRPFDRASATTAAHPNRYTADPKNRLDVAVGRIVNRLPVAVKVAPVAASSSGPARPGYKDESGQYWVGDPEPKLCFCRILRSKTVMVRVGGGWQELSQFILQHYAHLAGLTITPTSSPNASLKTPTHPAASPWFRSASGSVHASQQRPSQRPQPSLLRFNSPPASASPLIYQRPRVESMPADVLASPGKDQRRPSLSNDIPDHTPSKIGLSRRYASSSSAARSKASLAPYSDDLGAVEAVMDAKLSLF